MLPLSVNSGILNVSLELGKKTAQSKGKKHNNILGVLVHS